MASLPKILMMLAVGVFLSHIRPGTAHLMLMMPFRGFRATCAWACAADAHDAHDARDARDAHDNYS